MGNIIIKYYTINRELCKVVRSRAGKGHLVSPNKTSYKNWSLIAAWSILRRILKGPIKSEIA
jgi:hypothetical protein